MTRNPMVSIVIPVYNGANYLREAIDSALAQTYPHVEVIVVNDGSNDGGRTRDVATSFGSRVRYFEKENGGVATAMNLAIREMRGTFFSWLSHDDVYYPEKIARQVAFVQEPNEDRTIVFSNYHIIDHLSRVTGTAAMDAFAQGSSILAVVGTYVNGCSMLIPKAAFDAAGVFNESLRNSQDNELWLRMVTRGYRLQYMPDILMKSRRHADQGSLTEGTRHAQEARAFYVWALTFMGREHRMANAAGLCRILLARRLPSLLARFLSMLKDDRSLWFAVSAMTAGAGGLARTTLLRRLAARPGMQLVLSAARRLRFRNSSHYWENRYRQGDTSGVGSYGKYAEYKAEVLNAFVAAHGIRRVAEFGCGDGNQLKHFRFPEYLGLDVSSAAVERCRRWYRDDGTKRFLTITGRETIEAVRRFGPELTLSLDVIYHLVEDAVFAEHIANLFDVSSRYVVLYSSNFDRQYDSPHQVDRKFTDHIAEHIPGWSLLEVIANPYKGTHTQSDFYVYRRKTDASPEDVATREAPWVRT